MFQALNATHFICNISIHFRGKHYCALLVLDKINGHDIHISFVQDDKARAGYKVRETLESSLVTGKLFKLPDINPPPSLS